MKLNDIRIDGGTQPRTSINEQVVSDYADAMRAGATFPPLTVFFDGADHWLADGFHRYHAMKPSGAVVDVDIRRGTRRDAVLFSVGANAAHGLRRTNDDKRKAVQTLLADAEWSAWSDRRIAEACGVGHPLVASLRPRSLESDSSEKPEAARKVKTKHGTETTMKTAGIAASNQQRAPAKPATKPEPKKTAQEVEREQAAEDAFGDTDPVAMLEGMHKQVEELTALVVVAEADDAKAEALKWRRAYDAAVRAQSEAMTRAKEATDREAWTMRQLRRCGKAIGQDDPTKIAAAVEAALRVRVAA